MRDLRESTKSKFEEMREKARNAVRGIPSTLASSGGYTVGPMGRIKGFGELQDSIMKMRENFDFLVLGKAILADQNRMSPCMLLESTDYSPQQQLMC